MDIEPSQDGMSELLSALDEPVEEQEAEQAAPETEEQAPEPQEEAAVIDLDGKKLEIPAGTPPQIVETVKKMADDLKADYTRKTQAAAEANKQIQGAAQALQHQQQLMAATAEQWADFRAAQQKVEQFKAVDWQSLADEDPAKATKLMAMYQTAQSEVQAKQQAWTQALGQLNTQAEQQRAAHQAAQWGKAVEAARTALDTAFSDKSNEQALEWLTKKAGTSDARAIQSRFADPVVLEAIFKAAQWDALSKPMQKVQAAPKVIKPAAVAPRENQSALERLKKTGRASELINFL